MKLDVIYTEDSLKGIPRRLPDNSVDLIPTDPPYGIAFMGKEWDKFNQVVNPQGTYESAKGFRKLPRQSTASMQEFFVPIWRECLRVLKSGAFAFVMCSPRADVMATQILCLQEAGFMVGFTPIFWAYASGFPKAQNIGKAVDKRKGIKRKIIVHNPNVRKSHKGHILELGLKQEGLSIPATPQAQALDGSYAGFQPKPAVEVVIVAMKPLSEKTYIDQALRNGKGVTWLDEGRIPYESKRDRESARFGTQMDIRDNNYITPKGIYGKNVLSSFHGRFPANLLVSDDALNDGKVLKTGDCKPHIRKGNYKFTPPFDTNYSFGDFGSFSRYFSLDAWFDKRLKELPAGVRKTFPFLIVPKASKAEKNRGCEELYWEKDGSSFGYRQIERQRWEWLGREEERIYKETGKRISLRARGNVHPTVKPVKLVSYLITIGSRLGDVILDPFMGSGTTPVGATILGRRYVAFETEAGNVRIAEARLSVLEPQLL